MEQQIRSLGVITSTEHEKALREVLSGASVVDDWHVGDENPDLSGILGRFYDTGTSTVVIDAAGLPYRDVSDADLLDWLARNPSSGMRIVYITDTAAQRDDAFVHDLIDSGVSRIVMLRYAESAQAVGDEAVSLALGDVDESEALARLANLPEPGKSGRLTKLFSGRKKEQVPDVLAPVEEEDEEELSGPVMGELEWMQAKYGAAVPDDLIEAEKEAAAEDEPEDEGFELKEPEVPARYGSDRAAENAEKLSGMLANAGVDAATVGNMTAQQMDNFAKAFAMAFQAVAKPAGDSANEGSSEEEPAAVPEPAKEAPVHSGAKKTKKEPKPADDDIIDVPAEAVTVEPVAKKKPAAKKAQQKAPEKVKETEPEPAPEPEAEAKGGSEEQAAPAKQDLPVAAPLVNTVAVCGILPGTGTTHLAVASAVHFAKRYPDKKVVMLFTDPGDYNRIRGLLDENSKPKGSDVEFRIAKTGGWPDDCDIAVSDCGVLAYDTQSRSHAMFSTAKRKLVTVGGDPWTDISPLKDALLKLDKVEFTSMRWCLFGASSFTRALLRMFAAKHGIGEEELANKLVYEVPYDRSDLLYDPVFDQSMLSLYPAKHPRKKGRRKRRGGQQAANAAKNTKPAKTEE